MRSWKSALLACALLSLSASASRADTVFTTATGAKDAAGAPIDASVTFSSSGNTLTILLQNLQTGMSDIGQAINGVSFTLPGTSESTASITNQTGQLIDFPVKTLGLFVDVGGSPNWAKSGSGASYSLGNPTSSDTILGPSSGGFYTNADSSIDGNLTDNPFAQGSVDFTMNIPGLTSADVSDISNVVFGLGTSTDSSAGVSNTVTAVPMPRPALACGGLFLVLLGSTWLRRRSA